jgi:diguanylate cyclase (GGDEF)-like protein
MKHNESTDNGKEFFTNPKVVDNYALLQNIGVFSYIDSLEEEITNYKNLFSGALDIVNCTTISEIMDATVWQISDHFLPSIILFLWKPLQNREEITVKCYKNYQLVDINLHVESIATFEHFFRRHPEPITYKLFSSEFGRNKNIKTFDSVDPELVIPILGPSGLYGFVLMGRNILGIEYSKKELSYIQNLMSFVSKAIQNNLHYERTLRDIKTGLYNNAFFITRLSEEIVRSKRNNTETSIIIMDVDHFKDFNDTYGHLAGDRVLESLAITIKQGVRAEDVPSRFGGEEFTVLLPDACKKTAWIVAERLRTMVEETRVAWEPPLPKVTISLGIFTFNKSTNISVDEIISRADEALYLSKQMGRNRTTAWGVGLFSKIQKSRQPVKPAAKKPTKHGK